MFNGSRLKDLRKRRGLTQKELGNMVNVTKTSISCYENGSRIPNMETFIELIKIFDVSPNYLLSVDEYEKIYNDDANYMISCTYDDYEILRLMKKNNKVYDMLKKNTKDVIKFLEDNYKNY